MPLQRAIIERSPFHLSISNVRTLKRHKCRAPSRSVATLSIALGHSWRESQRDSATKPQKS